MRAEHRDDSLTLTALGVLAFALANVTHEALGHGLAALAAGARPVLLTTCYFVTSGSTSRWIPAGGGIANLGVGLLALLWLRIFRPRSPHFGYFLVSPQRSICFLPPVTQPTLGSRFLAIRRVLLLV
jgi:hypothetical protein